MSSSMFSSYYLHLILQPPSSPLFPYTTLFRSDPQRAVRLADVTAATFKEEVADLLNFNGVQLKFNRSATSSLKVDRKSTRMNSSHVAISYAVFCLKKKNKLISLLIPSN